MTDAAQSEAFNLLVQMQERVRALAPQLPEQVEATPLWTGLGFRLDDAPLLVSLDQIAEILPRPVTTRVPGTKRWVKGIANIRGTLLTVIDLAEFFGKPPVPLEDKVRLLVMHVGDLSAGLLVNEVSGLKHFDVERDRRDIAGLDNAVLMHVQTAYMENGVLWGVFDLRSLSDSLTFKHVAA
ncbi:MAG: chemotaxis protein CheW [Gammaproteobacteria bacterium]|nr:chemotaxis protein CheW [Gammaproteobacteria bacterium]